MTTTREPVERTCKRQGFRQEQGGARQQVELVEVAVHQALGGQTSQQVHQCRIHRAGVLQLAHLPSPHISLKTLTFIPEH